MGQNKGIAQRIFNKKNFGTITIDLTLQNLTTSTQTAESLELLEFEDDHIVLGTTVQFGALGHQIILDVAVFVDQTRQKEVLRFQSKCKVTFFEKKVQDPAPIFIAHIAPEAGDLMNWKRLIELYTEKQGQVNEYLGKIKGTE